VTPSALGATASLSRELLRLSWPSWMIRSSSPSPSVWAVWPAARRGRGLTWTCMRKSAMSRRAMWMPLGVALLPSGSTSSCPRAGTAWRHGLGVAIQWRVRGSPRRWSYSTPLERLLRSDRA